VSDAVAIALTVLGFATLVSAHVAIAFGLFARAPRWHAAIAFFVPPFAPLLAWRSRAFVRAGVWIAAAIVYAVGLWRARR
jgi:hypothetical protein